MAIVEFKDVTRVYTSGDHELKALEYFHTYKQRACRSLT